VAIALIDSTSPLKVEDTLFFPRIPDGGIVPMVIALHVAGVEKERKS
jgi:hypothetical protein